MLSAQVVEALPNARPRRLRCVVVADDRDVGGRSVDVDGTHADDGDQRVTTVLTAAALLTKTSSAAAARERLPAVTTLSTSRSRQR